MEKTGNYKIKIKAEENSYKVQLYKKVWILFIPVWFKYKDSERDQLPYGANCRHLQNIWGVSDKNIIFQIQQSK